LKAEQWARNHGHAFPKIKGNPIIKDPDIRECYVFHDKDDDTCPMILHFPIVNKTYKPDFPIFDDPDDPYSSFKFQYAPETFQRLHELMKFNTLLNVDLIKEKIAYYVGHRRNNRKYAERFSHQ
jgi:phospholipase A2